MKELLDESNFKMKQSLKELDSIDFSKLPDGPEKVKLKAIVEESKKLTAEVLENSTYDKLLGTSDLTPNEVPSADDASKLSKNADAAAELTTGSGLIDPISGNRAAMKLDELSDDLRKQLDQLDSLGPYLKKNGIKFDTFTRNNALMFVDNAKDGVKHFTDTKFLQQMRRVKQLAAQSAGGKMTSEAIQNANNALNKRLTKGTQFINDCMNSSLGKGLKAAKEAAGAASNAASEAAKKASKTATKKLGKEVMSEAGGMGIGAVVAVGVEIFSQLIESGSVDGEALKQVLKEEAISMAIEAGILAVATAGVMAATGATAGAAAATAFGPVGMAVAAIAIAGAALDASPAGQKFASLLFAKDLHAMKNNYDESYEKYYSYNKSGFKRMKIKNWAGGTDIVMEANVLDLDENGGMTETGTLEFTGYLAEFFEINNLIHGPGTMDVFMDVYDNLLETQIMKERDERRSNIIMNTILLSKDRKRSPTLMQNYLKHKLAVTKAEFNILRAKSRAIKSGGINSSQRLVKALMLQKLGFSRKDILRLTHPDY